MRSVRVSSDSGHICRSGFLFALRFVWLASTNRVIFADDVLKVHEWGTFTVLQDEYGNAFSGINTDDEPVPKFAHRLFYPGEFSPTNMPPRQSKGVNPGLPNVTMRLETPVTYFHLPESAKEMTLDFSAQFHGGWLTEFFPKAVADIDGRTVADCKKEALERHTVGRIAWNGIRLGTTGEGPKTDENVWLAPRQVDASQVTIGQESERFLFYRGVGYLDAPLRIARPKGSNRLQVRNSFRNPQSLDGLQVPHMWLVEIATSGKTASRSLHEIALTDQPNQLLCETTCEFNDDDFSSDNLEKLKSNMRKALVKDGLFDDEAVALLKTWELSYFQSPGMRLFFLVPQVWTDAVLPIKLSVPAEVTRVMVGRVELVTPKQLRLLKKLAGQPLADLTEVITAVNKLRTSPSTEDRQRYNALASGRGQLSDLHVSVPDCYQTFLELGRFRSSLLINATWSRSRPVRGLAEFMREVEKPGADYAMSIVEQRNRDKAERQHKNLLDRQIASIELRTSKQPRLNDATMLLGDSTFERWDLAKSFGDRKTLSRSYDWLLLTDLPHLVDRIVLPQRPSVIVIHAGAKDIARGFTTEECVAGCRAFVAKVHEKLPQTRIVFVSSRPSSLTSTDFASQAEVNDLLQDFSRTDERLKFVDFVSLMRKTGGTLRPELFEDRTANLSDSGYQLLSDTLKRVLDNRATGPSIAR